MECFDGSVDFDTLPLSANIIFRCTKCIQKYKDAIPSALRDVEQYKKSVAAHYADTTNNLEAALKSLKEEHKDCGVKLQDAERKCHVETRKNAQYLETEKMMQTEVYVKNNEIRSLKERTTVLSNENELLANKIQEHRADAATIENLKQKVHTLEVALENAMDTRESEHTNEQTRKRPRTSDAQAQEQNQDIYSLIQKMNDDNLVRIEKVTHEMHELAKKADSNLAKFMNELNMNLHQNLQSQAPLQNSIATPMNMNAPNAPMNTQKSMNATNATNRKPVQVVEMSYAQALQNSAFPPENIRNLVLIGSSEHVTATMEKINADTVILDMKLMAIIRKSENNFTIKCPDKDTADKFHEHMQKTYSRASVVCTKVQMKRPQIKISGARIPIVDDESDEQLKETVLVQIRHQNQWMSKMEDIVIEEVYQVTTARIKYVNVIISSGLKTQESLLKKGTIILGFTQCRVSEHIDMIQCQNCNRFGHFRHTCTFTTNCRKCGQAHDKSVCDTVNPNPSCNNCLLANAQGASHNVRHRVTDDRCPIKVERINALKIQLLRKN